MWEDFNFLFKFVSQKFSTLRIILKLRENEVVAGGKTTRPTPQRPAVLLQELVLKKINNQSSKQKELIKHGCDVVLARGHGRDNPGRRLLSLEEISLLCQGHPSREIGVPLGCPRLQAQVDTTGSRCTTGTQMSAQPKEGSSFLFSKFLSK